MMIEIDDNRTIGEIRDQFSAYFPFLKIEFFRKPHSWQQSSSLKDILPHTIKLHEIRKKHQPGFIEIHSIQKTGAVEQEFERHFGLHVQVFRKNRDSWIQTAGTDEISLEEQNQIGKELSEDTLHGTDRKFEGDDFF
ncbi:MAG: hypothetical protein JST96_06895 [Bacteroidetes bacterium]|nr:hypothetical protein [Bacteroidota bacterium]